MGRPAAHSCPWLTGRFQPEHYGCAFGYQREKTGWFRRKSNEAFVTVGGAVSADL
jgi:hypothetical protein